MFKYIAVMSNEELMQLSLIDKITAMPIYAEELLRGSQALQHVLEENNNKYSNHLLLAEDEQHVYLAPSPHKDSCL